MLFQNFALGASTFTIIATVVIMVWLWLIHERTTTVGARIALTNDRLDGVISGLAEVERKIIAMREDVQDVEAEVSEIISTLQYMQVVGVTCRKRHDECEKKKEEGLVVKAEQEANNENEECSHEKSQKLTVVGDYRRGAWVVKIVKQDASVEEVIRCQSDGEADKIAEQLIEKMRKLNIPGVVVVGYEVD